MNTSDITEMAHELIKTKLQANEIVAMEWAVHELILKQGDIEGSGVEFYRLCAREYCHRLVKRVVDKYQGDASNEDRQQILLPGFDYLQIAYTVERNGEICMVPIDMLSDAEIDARADEFDKQAEGLKAHAKELRNYRAKRNTNISLAS